MSSHATADTLSMIRRSILPDFLRLPSSLLAIYAASCRLFFTRLLHAIFCLWLFRRRRPFAFARASARHALALFSP